MKTDESQSTQPGSAFEKSVWRVITPPSFCEEWRCVVNQWDQVAVRIYHLPGEPAEETIARANAVAAALNAQ